MEQHTQAYRRVIGVDRGERSGVRPYRDLQQAAEYGVSLAREVEGQGGLAVLAGEKFGQLRLADRHLRSQSADGRDDRGSDAGGHGRIHEAHPGPGERLGSHQGLTRIRLVPPRGDHVPSPARSGRTRSCRRIGARTSAQALESRAGLPGSTHHLSRAAGDARVPRRPSTRPSTFRVAANYAASWPGAAHRPHQAQAPPPGPAAPAPPCPRP